ncbi:MAG: 4Fe-4S binding protein [Treponema sp.]|jgi:iron only hydrogenase large subunit-like protein|nr:4Fe-4S binding protein [Treponema sp.]
MQSSYPIYTELADCQDCYKCIRRCPVKAIRVENSHAQVIPDACVACGRCVIHCPAFAKRARNDVGRVKRFIIEEKKVFVSLAPSYISEFSEFTPRQLELALKRLGFFAVSETALGADFVSAQIASDMETACEDSGQKLFISSACPAVVEYIKRYTPELAPYITNRASPLLAHARLLRRLYGNIAVVFIGPCIAKKREADQWNEIDAALTFKELRDWLKAEAIVDAEGVLERVSDTQNATIMGAEGALEKMSDTQAKDEPKFLPRRAAKGALYPIDGGMIQSWKNYSNPPAALSMAISGVDAIEKTLSDFDVAALTRPLFLELLFCSGGCINGPGASNAASGMARRMRLLEYAEMADNTLDSATLAKRVSLTDTLSATKVAETNHTEAEIQGALRQVGKFSIHDELNCSSCGYDTCRNFARAMLDKRAERTMCVSYMRKLAQKKANGLIRAIPSGVVIVDKELKIVECNENFARLMGKELRNLFEILPGLEGADLRKITRAAHYFTDVLSSNSADEIECDIREGKKILHLTVFVVEKGEIAAGVIDDITLPQVRKDKTVSRAQKIIDKNVAAVQKIAFLLGENAAETEAILNSIIESYSEGDSN